MILPKIFLYTLAGKKNQIQVLLLEVAKILTVNRPILPSETLTQSGKVIFQGHLPDR